MSTIIGRIERRFLTALLFGAMVLLLVAGLPEKGLAQCADNSCVAAWQPSTGTQSIIFVLSSGCPVSVDYRIRCCGDRQEVYISYITTADPCCSASFSSMTVQQIVGEVATKIMNDNSGVLWGGCASTIRRVTKPTCWKMSSSTVVEPCTPIANCCFKQSNGVTGFVPSSSSNCSSYPPGDNCQFVCP